MWFLFVLIITTYLSHKSMTQNYFLLCFLAISTFLVTIIDANEAILDGEKAKDDQFPYQVSVQFPDVIGHNCGGGIIGNQHILTAAHCVIGNNNKFYNYSTMVVAGTVDLRRTKEPAVTVSVEKMYVPKEYIRSYLSTTGDIAVIKLKEPLKLSKHLMRLQLPKNQQESYANETGIIAGFGRDASKIDNNTRVQYHSDTHLRFAEVEIFSNAYCQKGFKVHIIHQKHLCARVKEHGFSKPLGTCTGDSGSPLVYEGKTVIAILSRSPKFCLEQERPAMYTRVSNYLTFIHNAMKDKETKNMRTYSVHS